MGIQAPHKKFTVEQYHQMAASGILTERDRVELIEGEIVQMSPIGRKHAVCVDRLTVVFVIALSSKAVIRVQNPIHLSDNSEPEPDFAIVRGQLGNYLAEHPEPKDVIALVEVSDSTIQYDRETKALLYAQKGIQELWLMDLNELTIEVFRMPGPTGYQDIQTFQKGQSLAFQGFPDTFFVVEQLLKDFF